MQVHSQRALGIEAMEPQPVGMPWKREMYVSAFERSRALSKMRKARYVASRGFNPPDLHHGGKIPPLATVCDPF